MGSKAIRLTLILFFIIGPHPVWARHGHEAETQGTGGAPAPRQESFVVGLMKSPNAAFAPQCPQFDATKNGDTVWSPYFWQTRAVGAHIVRDQFLKQAQPVFGQIAELLPNHPLTKELTDPNADPGALLASLNELLRSTLPERTRSLSGLDLGPRRGSSLFPPPRSRGGGIFDLVPRGSTPRGRDIPKPIDGATREKLEALVKKLPALAKVAVLDSGMDTDNPWLKGRLTPFSSSGPGDDKEAHAVHVGGIIAGRWPLGIASFAQIRPVKVIGQGGQSPQEAMRGLYGKVHLTNNSWGYSLGAPSKVFNQSARSTGKTMVHFMAAGNSGEVEVSQSYDPSLIKVGSLTPTADRSSFSCVGRTLCVAGFGSDVWSAHATGIRELGPAESAKYPMVPKGTQGLPEDMRRLSGTSMATPVVTGVAANVVSAFPDVMPIEMLAILRSTAIPVSGNKVLEGEGYVNAVAAKKLAEAYKSALSKSEPFTPLSSEYGTRSSEQEILKALRSENLAEQRAAIRFAADLSSYDEENTPAVQAALAQVTDKVGKRLLAMADFREEGKKERLKAVNTIADAFKNQDCNALEEGLKSLEHAFFLNPDDPQNLRDLTLMYSLLSMDKEAVRSYAMLSDPGEFLSDQEEKLTHFERLLQDDNPQVVAAGYKALLRHTTDPKKRRSLVTEALKREGVAAYLGEVIRPDELDLSGFTPKESLNILPLLQAVPPRLRQQLADKVQSHPPQDPVVARLVAGALKRTGRRLPAPSDANILKFYKENEGALTTALFDEETNQSYRQEVLKWLNGLSSEQGQQAFDLLKAQDKSKLLELMGHIQAGSPFHTLLEDFLVGDSGVSLADLMEAKSDATSRDGLVLPSRNEGIWAKRFFTPENYLKLLADGHYDPDYGGGESMNRVLWSEVMNNPKQREEAKNVARKFAKLVEEKMKYKTGYDACYKARKSAVSSLTNGKTDNEGRLLPLLCPLLVSGDGDFLSEFEGNQCFTVSTLAGACGISFDGGLRFAAKEGLIDLSADEVLRLEKKSPGLGLQMFESLDSDSPEFAKGFEALLQSADGVQMLWDEFHPSTGRGPKRGLVNRYSDLGPAAIAALFKHYPSQGTEEEKEKYDFLLSQANPLRSLKAFLTYEDPAVREGVLTQSQFTVRKHQARQALVEMGTTLEALLDPKDPMDGTSDLEWMERYFNGDVFSDYGHPLSTQSGIRKLLIMQLLQGDPQTVERLIAKKPDAFSQGYREAIRAFLKDKVKERDPLSALPSPQERFDESVARLRTRAPVVSSLDKVGSEEWENHWERLFEFQGEREINTNVENLRRLLVAADPRTRETALAAIVEMRFPDDRLTRSLVGGGFTPKKRPEKYLSALDDALQKYVPAFPLLKFQEEGVIRSRTSAPDYGKLSVQAYRDFLSRPVTEVNYLHFASIMRDMIQHIDELPEGARRLVEDRYYRLSRTNLWR